ncbi:hypothetical protein [Haladaptatus sp. NG-SE-30]
MQIELILETKWGLQTKKEQDREEEFGTVSTIYKYELEGYKESLKVRYDYEGDEEMKTQFRIAESLLGNAEIALQNNDELSFLRYFYSALRRQLPILEKLDALDVKHKKVDLQTDRVKTDGGTLPLEIETRNEIPVRHFPARSQKPENPARD